MLAFFPPTKWAGLFPSAAYRRSVPPQVALGRLKWRRLGCSDAAEMVSQRRETGLIFILRLALYLFYLTALLGCFEAS